MSKSESNYNKKSTIILPHALREAIALFGDDVVFLPCYPGSKKPMLREWEKLTCDAMRDPEHLQKLAEAHNFSVVTGIASGGVISIDIDSDEAVEALLIQNPQLRSTFRTKGRRGCNIWVRMLSCYPPYSELKLNGKHWGEFRSHYHQTVIWGRHPDGMYYKWVKKAPLIVIPFDSIIWPPDLEWVTSSDPVETGKGLKLAKHCQDGKEGKDGKDGRDVVCVGVCSVSLPVQQFTLEDILKLSMPSEVHDTHSRIFMLARGGITLEQQEGRKFTASQLEDLFDRWHAAVPPSFLSESKENYLDEFFDAYLDAKHPLGGVSLQQAYELARAQPFPSEALQFKDQKKRLMVAILFHLQEAAGDEPIFFPVLKAEKLLGVPARTCTYWLSSLVVRKILQVVCKADKIGRKATRYRLIRQSAGEPNP